MDLSLPGDLEQFVEQQVAVGAYSSPSEVVGDALRLMQLHERERAALVEDLRQKIAVGVGQLERGQSISADDVYAELKQRNARADV